jgi:hypothetical protein
MSTTRNIGSLFFTESARRAEFRLQGPPAREAELTGDGELRTGELRLRIRDTQRGQALLRDLFQEFERRALGENRHRHPAAPQR